MAQGWHAPPPRTNMTEKKVANYNFYATLVVMHN